MGKLTRSKPSRSTRKQGRERRERAVMHGLPAAIPALPRKAVAVDPGIYRDSVEAPISAVPSYPSAVIQKSPSLWEQIRGIPPSLQLLGAGILVLIGIGLFRRYTEEVPKTEEVPSVGAAATLRTPVGAVAPSAVAASARDVNSASASTTSKVNSRVDPSANSAEPALAPIKKSNKNVVAGKEPKSERKLGRSAHEPITPALSSPDPTPAANAVSNAKPASAENPY